MKIRSITCFYHPGAENAGEIIDRLGEFAAVARTQFNSAGFQVQSTRLATVPFPEMCPSGCRESGVALVQKLEHKAQERGFDYLSMGPALPDSPESYSLIPEMLEETKTVFFSANLIDLNGRISISAIRSSAEIIHRAADIEKDGFANLRFAAVAGVKPFTPFFPAAFSSGKGAAFSIAVECADVFVIAFRDSNSLKEAHDKALEVLEDAALRMGSVCLGLQKEFPFEFKGFDFSPAPYPGGMSSIGNALESLGVPELGLNGSAAAAAFLAGLLDEGNWPRVGFNGLMLPVLEDTGLAGRATEGTLTIRDLLLYSCLCGTGLDTIPLAGETTVEQIVALLLDLAAISVRLSKPLTARLMPIPGKKTGEEIRFDFEYFAAGKVMDLPAKELKRFFTGEEPVIFQSRKFPGQG
jgi:uncharacterized protein (UPF0210 family)